MGIISQENKMTPEQMQTLPLPSWCKPKSELEEKWLREICEYEFYNQEEPGMIQKFPYGSTKHNCRLTLMHGGKYKLPRFIAQHLEKKSTPIWKWRPDGTGSMSKKQDGTKPRFQLRPVFG